MRKSGERILSSLLGKVKKIFEKPKQLTVKPPVTVDLDLGN